MRLRRRLRSVLLPQKRSRRTPQPKNFLNALEFTAVLDYLDGQTLFVFGCCDQASCSTSEAFCRSVVQARGWVCGVGQSARQRLSRGGVFIDGITAYHDASQQPFNYRTWFDKCTTHSTLRIDDRDNRCDEFRSIVAVGCAEPALASGAPPPLAFEVRAAALEGYELHVGVATGEYDSMSHPSVSEHCWLLDLREGAFVHRGAFRRNDMWSSSTDEAFKTGDTVGLALTRDGSCVFYRNGRRLASRAGHGGWGPRLPLDASVVPTISIARSPETRPASLAAENGLRTSVAAPTGSARLRLEISAWRPPSGARSSRIGACCGCVVFALYLERVLRVATRTAWVPLELSAFGDCLLYSVAWSAAWQDHVLKHTDGVLRRSRRGLRHCVRVHAAKCVAVASAAAAVASAATRPFADDLTVRGFLDQRLALAYVATAFGGYALAHFLAIAARVGDARRGVNVGVVLIFASFFLHNWCAHDGWVLAFLAPAPAARGVGRRDAGECADFLGDDGLSQYMHRADLHRSLATSAFESRGHRDASRAEALAYPLWAVWLALEVLVDVEVFRNVVVDDATVFWRAALPVGRPAALPLAPPHGPPNDDDEAAHAPGRHRDVESQRMFAASVLLPLTILHCFHLDVAKLASGDSSWSASTLLDLTKAAAAANRDDGHGAGPAAADALAAAGLGRDALWLAALAAYALALAFAFAWAVYQWHVVLGLLKRFRDLLRISLDDDTASDALAPDAAYPYACHYYPFAPGSRADKAFVLLTYAYVVAWLYGGWWLGFARPHRAAWLDRAYTWPFHCEHGGLDLACLADAPG